MSLPGLAGLGPAGLCVDALSGLFLVITFGVAIPALIAAAASGNRSRPRLPAAVGIALAAVAVIITTDNVFVLLFGWELLTVAFYLLAGYDRDLPGRAAGSIITVVFGKVSGAAVLMGALLLASRTHSFAFSAGAVDPHSAVGQAAYALLLFGFGVKVGLVPAHIWMPRGYAAAPGPARAIMAGAAVNVGFYGMWRTLERPWIPARVAGMRGVGRWGSNRNPGNRARRGQSRPCGVDLVVECGERGGDHHRIRCGAGGCLGRSAQVGRGRAGCRHRTGDGPRARQDAAVRLGVDDRTGDRNRPIWTGSAALRAGSPGRERVWRSDR